MKHHPIIDTAANTYDAHIYFQAMSVEEDRALDVAGKLEALFGDAVEVHYPRTTAYEAPHPTNHIDVLFPVRQMSRMLRFFQDNHASLSVLIHPQSGNPALDMTKKAITIGPGVDLSFSA